MPRPYFTLLSKDAGADHWTIEFGDYDRDTVKGELDEIKYSARWDRSLRASYKIIRTANARQQMIVDAVAQLNLQALGQAAAEPASPKMGTPEWWTLRRAIEASQPKRARIDLADCEAAAAMNGASEALLQDADETTD